MLLSKEMIATIRVYMHAIFHVAVLLLIKFLARNTNRLGEQDNWRYRSLNLAIGIFDVKLQNIPGSER